MGLPSKRNQFRNSTRYPVLIMLVAMIVGLVPFMAVPPVAAAGVVGTGTAASCTDAALDRALAGGGHISFNCGSVLTTIMITRTIAIHHDIAIDGGGLIALSGENVHLVMSIERGAHVNLKGLTIEDGHGLDGGGIFNFNGILTIKNCKFLNNKSLRGGAIYNWTRSQLRITGSFFNDNHAVARAHHPNAEGGAIFNAPGATLGVEGTTFAKNDAYLGGAIFSGARSSTRINNGTFQANHAGREGGAIWNQGNIKIAQSHFTENHSDDLGGAIMNTGHGDPPGLPSVYTGHMTIDHSELSSNSSHLYGGAVENDGIITITHSTISGNSSEGGAGVASFGSATLEYDTITGNRATAYAGGVGFNDPHTGGSIAFSTISGNSAGSGGGIYVGPGVGLVISSSTVTTNTAVHIGGGLYIDRYTAGDLAGNIGSVDFWNSTMSGNSAGDTGGGIESRGSLDIESSTIVENRAPTAAQLDDSCGHCGIPRGLTDGPIHLHPRILQMLDTIIAQSPPGEDNCRITYYWTDMGHNLSDDRSCFATVSGSASTDQVVSSVMLGPLADNTGPTQTHLPQFGSPAIDHGTCKFEEDQRGVARPQGGGCDIGSVEAAKLNKP